MDCIKFISWCETAVREIRYTPDRIAVQKELYAHMEDHYLDLIEQGVDEETARKQTVEAMGDPLEVARELARVHKPFWGYFLRATRLLLAGVLGLFLVLGIMVLPELGFPEPGYRAEARSLAPFAGNTCELLLETEPEAAAVSDGHHFSVPKAAVWETQDGTRILTVQVVQWHPVPLIGRAEPLKWFRGQDSNGTEYAGSQESLNTDDEYRISVFSYQVSPWKTIYRLNIWDFPEEADWFRLTYDRDGRNLSFHIPLTGGEIQ